MNSHIWLGTLIAVVFFCIAPMAAFSETSLQQRMRACAQEWDALKAKGHTAGKSYRDFERACLAGPEGLAPRMVGTAQRPEEPAPGRQRPVRSAMIPAGWASVSEAQSSCPSGTVVWVNTRTKIYHVPGSRLFGNTKQGTYMCRSESERAGVRAAKGEKAAAAH
jgi:hypothetical protein